MGRCRKNKYRDVRKDFKKDLYNLAIQNSAVPILIMETYVASHERRHIHQIWGLLREFPDAQKAYNERLFGKTLTGRDEIMRSLYFVDKVFYDKYVLKIPEKKAMGDAVAIAYRIQREIEMAKTETRD